MLSAQLGTTPPQISGSYLRSNSKRSSGGVVAFRSNTSEDVSGSVGRTPGSLAELNSWRSFSRSSRDTTESVRLRQTTSIPKSESFVKVEGFDTTGTSPFASPPASPIRENSLGKAQSMLARELSLDNLTGAVHHHDLLTDTASIVQRLEECATIKVEPVLRPASLPRRSSIPDDLLTQLQTRFPVFNEPLVIRAFNISRLAHDGRYDGPGGEPAFVRCASAAAILAELGADEASIAGALLHDALDRTMLVEGQLRAMLGSDEVIDLVKRVSHIGYTCSKFLGTGNAVNMMPSFAEGAGDSDAAPAGGLVDMLVAHSPPRALLIRLAVALQEVRSLDARGSSPASGLVLTPRSSSERQKVARASLAVWAPLANRLGVWSFKAELEDRAFRAIYPAEHAALREMLEEAQSPSRLVAMADRLRAALQEQGVEYVDLSGRPKHLWGVWCKMKTKGYRPEQVADVRGLRVIVRNREDCYKAMRAVETVWNVVGPSKNYIKCPKENGYQSLHTVADAGDGHMVEIQIRTDKMHYLAEYGVQAAHWRYKEQRAAAATQAAAATAEPGVAQEASWAKFETSRQLANDKKCRPSGSPDQDQSLDSILASIDLAADSSPGTSPSNTATGKSPSGRQSRSFLEYIEASGQRPAPPTEPVRVLVAVTTDRGSCVVSVSTGTTVKQLLEQCNFGAHPRSVQTVVNRHLEANLDAVLRPGDIVEIYAEHPSVPSPTSGSRQQRGQQQQRGNLLPLGKLRRPAAATVPDAAAHA